MQSNAWQFVHLYINQLIVIVCLIVALFAVNADPHKLQLKLQHMTNILQIMIGF